MVVSDRRSGQPVALGEGPKGRFGRDGRGGQCRVGRRGARGNCGGRVQEGAVVENWGRGGGRWRRRRGGHDRLVFLGWPPEMEHSGGRRKGRARLGSGLGFSRASFQLEAKLARFLLGSGWSRVQQLDAGDDMRFKAPVFSTQASSQSVWNHQPNKRQLRSVHARTRVIGRGYGATTKHSFGQPVIPFVIMNIPTPSRCRTFQGDDEGVQVAWKWGQQNCLPPSLSGQDRGYVPYLTQSTIRTYSLIS